MSIYMTEAEQLEAIKKWWQRYNQLITIVLSLVLLVVAGYKYWNWHQEKIVQQASNAYEHLMMAFSDQDNKAVRGYATQLLKEYEETVYADAARLALAKLLIIKEKYPEAKQQLTDIMAHSKESALKEVANLRLARLLVFEKSYDEALSTLTALKNTAYLPVVNELKGDIYAAKGQYIEAVDFYQKAINEVKTHGMGNLFLEMKTHELAAMTQSTKNEHQKTNAA